MGFQTDCISSHEEPEEFLGSIPPPIFESSLFSFDSYEEFERTFYPGVGDEPGAFIYTRGSNPTVQALERKVALLEGGEEARAFASGMAAIAAGVLSCVRTGEHVLVTRSLYSNAYRLFAGYLPRLGIECSFVDFTDLRRVEEAVQPNTRLFYLESPGNPAMTVLDLRAIDSFAGALGVETMIDNTVAGPYNQLPLRYGMDLVVHSASKYLSGHSDVVAGVLVGSAERMRSISHNEVRDLGSIIGPFEAWLVLRGLRTLGLRMRAHNAAGMAVARWLNEQPEVEEVMYPGLPSHPQHDLASSQMTGFGGLLAVALKGSRQTAINFADRLNLFGIGVSYGGFESLALPFKLEPNFPEQVAAELGITPSTVRLFVGLEDVEDLIVDLEQALRATAA